MWRNPWGGMEDVRLVVRHSRLFSHKWTVCFCFVIEENDFDFSYVKRRNAMSVASMGKRGRTVLDFVARLPLSASVLLRSRHMRQ